MRDIARLIPVQRNGRWCTDDRKTRAAWRGVRPEANSAALDYRFPGQRTKNINNEVDINSG
jgi:hypothetical protein